MNSIGRRPGEHPNNQANTGREVGQAAAKKSATMMVKPGLSKCLTTNSRKPSHNEHAGGDIAVSVALNNSVSIWLYVLTWACIEVNIVQVSGAGPSEEPARLQCLKGSQAHPARLGTSTAASLTHSNADQHIREARPPDMSIVRAGASTARGR